MSENDKHYFFSRVFQREKIEPIEKNLSWLHIEFHYLKITRCWYNDPTYTDEKFLSGKRRVRISYSCSDHRREYAVAMAQQLLMLEVPREEQPTVLEKLFQVVRTARRLRRIIVVVADITPLLWGRFRDNELVHQLITECPDVRRKLEYEEESCFEMLELRDVDYHSYAFDRITWESFNTGSPRFVPATRSSIESLQKVRLDSLGEATIKENPMCSICSDAFAEDGRVDQLIVLLPCAHYYHVHCIVRWLEVNHVCPLCRYAMPTGEEGQPSNS